MGHAFPPAATVKHPPGQQLVPAWEAPAPTICLPAACPGQFAGCLPFVSEVQRMGIISPMKGAEELL